MKYVPVYNSSSESVPAYGLMSLSIDATATMEEIDGRAVWIIEKPDADAENLQDPSLLFVNGPVPIRAGHYGRGTQDWPVRVQMASGNLTAGDLCGPNASSWLATEEKSAFRFLSNDVLADFANSSLSFGWVAPAFGGTIILPATLSANLTSGNSANATLLTGASRSTNGDTVSVYDLPAFIPTGEQILTGSKIRVYYDNVAEKFVLLTSAVCTTDVPT